MAFCEKGSRMCGVSLYPIDEHFDRFCCGVFVSYYQLLQSQCSLGPLDKNKLFSNIGLNVSFVVSNYQLLEFFRVAHIAKSRLRVLVRSALCNFLDSKKFGGNKHIGIALSYVALSCVAICFFLS